ncbi:GtrA family protein [Arcanobacterium bovis]|uniref:GtrA family protein n=1 Tax=Arcanobacterium bovis TaxID=2529275 RepID=A0A4V6MYT8_9ACTO|nr:GtrA family protein [Arcanobacterium bovis]TBW23634.1 GtrA family protein [Arcanobacterium bovis]
MERKSVSLISQILKFGVVGVISTAVDYGGFLCLTYLLGINYLIASTISYTAGILVNYWLGMKYVFESDANRSKISEFSLYTVLTLIGMGLNQLFLYLLVDWALIKPGFAKLIATVLVMIYNFGSRKALIEPKNR